MRSTAEVTEADLRFEPYSHASEDAFRELAARRDRIPGPDAKGGPDESCVDVLIPTVPRETLPGSKPTLVRSLESLMALNSRNSKL